MKIEVYNTFECKCPKQENEPLKDCKGQFCKSNHFITKTEIDNKECLDLLLKEYSENGRRSNSNNVFFRGMNEAKYKLYTSGQRYWLTYDLNKIYLSHNPQGNCESFVANQIINARKKGLKKFYHNLGYKPYDHTILSFLQHYKGVTPLLDWTENIFVALYFALDGLKQIPTDNPIENYFSIYVINNSAIEDFNNLIEVDNLNINDVVDKIIQKTFKLNPQSNSIVSNPYYLKWARYPYSRKSHFL